MLNLWMQHMAKAGNEWESSTSLHPTVEIQTYELLFCMFFYDDYTHYTPRCRLLQPHTAQRYQFCMETVQLNAHQTNHKEWQPIMSTAGAVKKKSISAQWRHASCKSATTRKKSTLNMHKRSEISTQSC